MNDLIELVNQMNTSFGEALEKIEEGAADNNAIIRGKMKTFFEAAEQLQREIVKIEVSDLNNVKYYELKAIEEQKAKVALFSEHFDEQITKIEEQIRTCLGESSYLLNTTCCDM